MKLKIFVIAALSMTMATSAAAQVPTTLVDNRFNSGTLNWEGNGSTLVRWRAVIIDGNIAICSAYAVRGGRKYNNLSKQAVATIRIERNGSNFMPSLRHSAIHGSTAYSQRLVGSKANCRVTSTPGTPADLSEFRADVTPQRFRSN